MPLVLETVDFTRALHAEVQAIYCGPEDWSLAAARWIKAPIDEPGALRGIQEFGNSVWLYYQPDRQLVGFGSIGTTRWPFPSPSSPRQRVVIIPQLGIGIQFRSQPTGTGEKKFSCQIMEDLMAKAIRTELDIAVLTVHEGNTSACALYRKFGFVELSDRNPKGHVKMFRRLR